MTTQAKPARRERTGDLMRNTSCTAAADFCLGLPRRSGSFGSLRETVGSIGYRLTEYPGIATFGIFRGGNAIAMP